MLFYDAKHVCLDLYYMKDFFGCGVLQTTVVCMPLKSTIVKGKLSALTVFLFLESFDGRRRAAGL